MALRLVDEVAAASLSNGYNMRFAVCIALLALTSAAFTQTNERPNPRRDRVVWEPPGWNFPENVKATVPKEMLTTFRVLDYEIKLEETSINDVKERLGGIIGRKGDASDASAWLCFHGADATGRWVLWLENGEIDGDSVGGFQWQRLSNRDILDGRCHTLGKGDSLLQLPLSLRLGIRSAVVLSKLGPPTFKDGQRLIYLHEHEAGSARPEDPFISSNIVMVRIRNGVVWAIEASKTISD
jgi:hypothetical protein